ncbi:hypothetical protein SAMN02745206_03006 [Desulfacinum infernum DSM 9756]|uniref:Uncharacterized protein n=1 Tax=Desulfacinum infernum DSM 9756 TaxID=1121391 RepID=A0A1M5FY76_9BACT|nr:hypothetical protein [Desulfacinum infernum]SHF96141.1 hypothetical protein SAMN02745206_03006 [Desulfacinum infernum DSM 9756]
MKALQWMLPVLVLCSWVLAAPGAAQVDYPEEMAQVVAQYPDSTVEMAMKMQQGTQVMLHTKDEPKKVFAFYKEALSGDGWESQMEMAQEEGIQGHWVKGDRMMHVMVTQDEGETAVMLMLGKQQ